MAAWLLAPAACSLALLLWAEAHERRSLMVAGKALCSALFVLAALLLPHPRPDYFALVLAGLGLGLVGDVCLALPGAGVFRAGLAAFLLGHAMYVAAFAGLAPLSGWASWPAAVLAAAAGVVFGWLRGSVGRLLIPVALYILVISLMLAGAWAVFAQGAAPAQGAGAVLLGSLLFYLSDLCVARDRFKSPGFINRLLGLPLYYAGQFLLAWSVAWVG